MTTEDGRHGASGSPEPEMSREVRPGIRGWFGAAMAALTALLLVGTGNDLVWRHQAEY
jgi:hypothetical protein